MSCPVKGRGGIISSDLTPFPTPFISSMPMCGLGWGRDQMGRDNTLTGNSTPT